MLGLESTRELLRSPHIRRVLPLKQSRPCLFSSSRSVRLRRANPANHTCFVAFRIEIGALIAQLGRPTCVSQKH